MKVTATTTTTSTQRSPQLPRATLNLGDRGPAVAQVQRALRQLGYRPGPADGVFGQQTYRAMMQYQRDRGLLVNGNYSNASRHSMSLTLRGIIAPERALQKGDEGKSVRRLERALEHHGIDAGKVDGFFDANTAAALRTLQRRRGLKVTGTYNPRTELALKRALVDSPKMDALPVPRHDYRRVTVQGEIVNRRTYQMLRQANVLARRAGLPTPIGIIQGSYSSSVSASAGTHDGGGALDIRTSHLSKPQIARLVKVMRMVGFAAWSRGNGADSLTPHIHAIAIGDRQLSADARAQVRAYFAGRNGLANNGPDPDARVGRPFPAWAERYR